MISTIVIAGIIIFLVWFVQSVIAEAKKPTTLRRKRQKEEAKPLTYHLSEITISEEDEEGNIKTTTYHMTDKTKTFINNNEDENLDGNKEEKEVGRLNVNFK